MPRLKYTQGEPSPEQMVRNLDKRADAYWERVRESHDAFEGSTAWLLAAAADTIEKLMLKDIQQNGT